MSAVQYTIFFSALGYCGLAWEDGAIICVQLPEASRRATRERLLAKAGMAAKAAETHPPPWVTRAIARIERHLQGEPQDLAALPMRYVGVPDFHAKIYDALRRVPPGKTVTYGELAKMAGATPGASRAVGRAMALNPLPLLVPCHRVVATGGKPGGFSAFGGLVTKEKILAAEAAKAPLPFDAAAAIAHLTQADVRLAGLIAKVGPLGLTLKHTSDTFTALAESIVYQQLAGQAAVTIYARLRGLFPKRLLTARYLLRLSDGQLRAAGLSGSKAKSLRDLAERTVRGEIPSIAELTKLSDEEIIEKLTVVRGIGRWTVEMLLIFRLGRPDVFPLGDYGVRKGFARVFGVGKAAKDALPELAVMEQAGLKWRPFRSVASWYLWRALELP